MRRNRSLYIVAAGLLALCACGSRATEEKAVALPGEEKVLATVNGSAVTAWDLEQAMAASLGAAARTMLDARGRRSLLDSLVAARAIAQVQERALSAEEKAVLDREVAAYREQLLVKRYLARNGAAEPVTQAMVKDYYDKHPQQFGAKTIKDYELISLPGPLDDARRDQALAALKDGDRKPDWPAWVEQLNRRGIAVTHAGGSVDAAVLDGRLRDLLAPLKAGDKAAVSLSGGGVRLARVTAEKKIAPQPLDQVSARIRKTLLPVQLKKAVKQAADQVLAKAEVTYAETAE